MLFHWGANNFVLIYMVHTLWRLTSFPSMEMETHIGDIVSAMVCFLQDSMGSHQLAENILNACK